MQNNYNRPSMEFAGFWVRAAAYCIDRSVVFVGLLLVRILLSVVAGGALSGRNILFHYTWKDIILYVLQVTYFVLFTYYTGTTLGKKAMNLRVVNEDGSQKLNLIDVIYRETVGRFLCGLSVGIGYIMAGVDREKRGLHDMLCDTRVIYAKKVKVYPVYQVPQGWQVPPQGPAPRPPQGPAPMPPQGPAPMPPQGPGAMPPQDPSVQKSVDEQIHQGHAQ